MDRASETEVGEPLSLGKRILKDLRQQIIGPAFPPGTRLPTRAELERHYSTTPVTVQRVFNQLAKEGFIVSKGRQGTFISDSPPHLCSFVMVFPYRDRPERPWPQFWRALAAEAQKLERPGVTLTFAYGNETHEDLEPYAQLVEDVTSHRVAGLIFASKPLYLQGSPVLTAPGVPRVAVMAKADIAGVKAVSVRGNWFEQAINRLLAGGRHRLAVLMVPKLETVTRTALAACGVEVRPEWLQAVHPESPSSARNATHLLFSGSGSDRPDGLVIADDNLVEYATAGILDAGVRVPEDLTIVAHCNFPYPTPSNVPVIRQGYDVHEILTACMDNLIRQRQGGSVPEVTEIGVVTEEDGG